MLKRLELVGFKSFAEKTRFDFTPGVTAIVGPNGSGKSNIVDAVRWTLGEQSAKSLRGGEMADVIFNGSTSRRSLGLAEVTLTFDNTSRFLALDEPEVQITRRVYRSGEGEYLINQQPSRLKDVKDLFLGSGAGADAYCIIEQGKVDVLLQSSTRERRSVFEEAAGISRFKAKKTEALRKLERVDQNLLRLRDIAEEVDKQLRSVKGQAAKAERFQQFHSRLRELRLGLGLREFHDLATRLEAKTRDLNRLQAELSEQSARAEAWDAEIRRLEGALAALDEATHAQEAKLAQTRRQIAAEEATQNREWSLAGDLEADLAATRSHMTDLNGRLGALAVAAAQAAGELTQAETAVERQRHEVAAAESALAEVVAQLADLRANIQAHKGEHLEQMRQAARLQNDAIGHKAQVENLRRERERLLARAEQAAGHLVSLDTELDELHRAGEDLRARLDGGRQALADYGQQTETLRRRCDAAAQCAADLRAGRTGLVSRVEILERLEQGREGLGAGVRELMDILARPEPGPWRCVVGMAADLLRVPREDAPLIDLALGDAAQSFIVRDPVALTDALAARTAPFSGRISFRPLAPPPPPAGNQDPPLQIPGLIAEAHRLVTCDDPTLAGLPAQLLGRTLIVHDGTTALALARSRPGARFVTLEGEVLEADGTRTVGAHHAEAGILSRKSELRELLEQLAACDLRLADADAELAGLRSALAAAEAHAGQLQQQVAVLSEQAADLRSRLDQKRHRRQGLHEEVTLGRREAGAVERELTSIEQAWQHASREAEAAEGRVQRLQARLEAAEREVSELDRGRQARQEETAAARVALAKLEERLSALRAKHGQIQADLDERRREHAQGEKHLAGAKARLQESQRTMLQASASLAEWYLRKEEAERRLAELVRDRDLHRQERHLLTDQAQAARAEWRTHQEKAHGRELQVNDLRHRQDALVDRLREDYEIELAEYYREEVEAGRWPPPAGPSPNPGPTPNGSDPGAAAHEIEDLRRKIARLGNVNLEALQELADLESRANDLRTQLDDLARAKHSLEAIIQTINQDSRRLFTETFNAVRAHFQELFRKLFGGGMADVLLEDENDILESGIEIIARPPGKELRSISLMSGGEKTLTAVALLLAVFRSKPSPFCILDEVDAALDEANIGRYTAAVREFLDRSQFIIITHSKKTMAAADVLYGITMQESGVSKQVAVRFEDWPDDSPTAEPGPAPTRNGSPAPSVP